MHPIGYMQYEELHVHKSAERRGEGVSTPYILTEYLVTQRPTSENYQWWQNTEKPTPPKAVKGSG